MFSSKKCRAKKSQETQSPVTKLFKKMCKTSDSSSGAERENLIKQKKKMKKSQQSLVTNSGECPPPADTVPSQYNISRNQTQKTPEKKQSHKKLSQDREDTFSCTSCALKKCLTAESPKIVMVISIALAFILIVAFLNWLSCQPIANIDIRGEEIRDRRSDDSVPNDRKPWEESKLKLMSGLSDLMGTANKDPSMHDMNMDQLDSSMPELSSILDPVKVNEAYSSNSLRNFYRKLLKTDVQIKNLKKCFASLKRGNNNNFFDPIPQRAKRSAKVFTGTTRAHIGTPSLNKRSLRNLVIYYPPANGVRTVTDIEFDLNEDTEMSAFPDPNSTTEKEKEQKLLRQHSSIHKNNIGEAFKYTPSLTNYKTSSYQHETVHPYNKNSEKLEELLNRMLNKQDQIININIEDISDDDQNKYKVTTIKTDSMNTAKEESRSENTNEFQPAYANMKEAQAKTTEENKALYQIRGSSQYNTYKETTTAIKDEETDTIMEPAITEANGPESSTDKYEFMITLASVLGPTANKYRKDPTDTRVFFPKLRRLLQHPKNYDEDDDDDEEADDYEDQTKQPWEREKRMAKPTELKATPETHSTTNVPGVRNLNWKGPMPLYHDELNYMITAAMKMANEKNYRKSNKLKKTNAEENNDEHDENDANDYNELVEVAQAYSDYGVLDGKKETVEKNKIPVNLMSIESEKRRGVLERVKNKIDKSRQQLSRRLKIKSKGELRADTEKSIEKLGLHKRLSKNKLIESKVENENSSPAPSKLFDIVVDKSTTFRYPTKTYSARHGISAYPKESENHKEHGFYAGFRRSLKSIETDESNDGEVKDEPQLNNEEKYNISIASYLTNNSNDTVLQMMSKVNNETEIILRLSNDSRGYDNSKTAFGLGDIFSMIADFCLFLAGFDTEQEKTNFRSVNDFIAVLNPSAVQNNNKTNILKNDTKVSMTATFDSEAVNNIGHRSRVLLSFEEQINNVTSNGKEETGKSSEITNTEKNYMSLKNKSGNSVEKTNESSESDNITVVKRSANGNLLTWNDLYDDEYGVRDNLDNDMKEKSIDKFNELFSKSESWIENKFKRIADSVKNKKKHWKEHKHAKRNQTKTFTKRSIPKLNHADQVQKESGKQTFEALTANMKKVFHEAAAAIQDTANREARSDSEQASNLMQQLVGLMSELVDIQVRQKTCIPLPEDLRSFLAWLTAPTQQERNDLNFPIEPNDDYGPSTRNYMNMDSFELMSPNTRNDCLGTIHDVEELIQQYDEMSEEDKSKMSGVREYLEHQLNFLHKQLSNFNEFGFPVMYQDHAIRRRRQLSKQTKVNKRRPRKANRFMKFFGRKRTKATVYDEETSEDYSTVQRKNDEAKNDRNKQNDKKAHGKAKLNKKGDFAANKVSVNENERTVHERTEHEVSNETAKKRNLQDVFYSPLCRTNATTVKYITDGNYRVIKRENV